MVQNFNNFKASYLKNLTANLTISRSLEQALIVPH